MKDWVIDHKCELISGFVGFILGIAFLGAFCGGGDECETATPEQLEQKLEKFARDNRFSEYYGEPIRPNSEQELIRSNPQHVR